MAFSPAAFPGAPVRQQALEYIIEAVRQGECCAVVGPSNMGKSFLLKSLPTEEVRRRCAGPGAAPPVVVFIDCLEAGGTEQSFYELLLRRTIEELERAGVSPAAVDNLRNLHRDLLHSTVEVAVRSIYASSARRLGLENDLALVLVFDEFDDVFRHLPPWPFRQLRALTDALGPKLCYVTGASHHLEQLRDDADTYEFRELFHLRTLVLRPLAANEARQFADYLAQKQGASLSETNFARLIELSGGHPGLLERLFALLTAAGRWQAAPADLIKERPIDKECRRLWGELKAEQAALLALVGRGQEPPQPRQKQLLEAKGLVMPHNAGVKLFSPVFEAFIRQEMAAQAQTAARGLRCDFDTGQIWVDDQEITLQLSEPQRKLVTFLYQRVGAICTYDDIAIGVWGVGEGVSPGAIYELVKRVRQKIEPDWKNPQYIVTVPGKGYRLENPD